MTDGPRPSALSRMADDYAENARSQRAAFARTYDAVLAAVDAFDAEPTLRVVDLGAADGVNSHELITAIAARRNGRRLHYALVDLPTNVWTVAADSLDADRLAVVPDAHTSTDFVTDVGTGPHLGSADHHLQAALEAAARTASPTIVSLAGIPLQLGPSLPPGSVHIAVSGTAMHWVSDSGSLAATGSLFPGYPNHADAGEREAWAAAAARDWRRILACRADELAPGGVLATVMPASARSWPLMDGCYREISTDIDVLVTTWCADGRISDDTRRALTVPTWMRTPEELQVPFGEVGGTFCGLRLEQLELFHLDNPYWDEDPELFAARYVHSVAAWGGPLLARAFARSDAPRADALVDEFLAELARQVARDPARYRWDYTEALVVCRKVGDAGVT